MKKEKDIKKNKKKSLLPIIIGLVSGLVFSVALPLIMDGINSKINPPVEEEYVPLDPQFLEKPNDGSLPKDHTPLDNFRIAGGVLSLTESFRTEQTGNAISNSIIKNDQKVEAQRIINNKKAYVSHQTSSSFVESAVERFYLEDKVIIRNGRFENNQVIYSQEEEPLIYSYDNVLSNLGWLPFSLTSYIVNDQTIVSAKEVESEYPYSVELILDKEKAIQNTKKEVRYNANATTYPKYSQVKLTLSLDNDWKVLEIKNEDIYDITVKFGIDLTVNITSTLVEKFFYDNTTLDSISSYPYFSQFIEEEINDEEVEIKEKNAVDYVLGILFDVVLNGSTLNVSLTSGDSTLEGKVNINFDMNNMTGIITGLFSDFFFKYDGNLYLSYLKHNYKFDSNFLEHLLNKLGISLEEAASIKMFPRRVDEKENDPLTELMDNMVLEKNENDVKVSGNINEENLDLTFTFNLLEIEQGVLLRSIVLEGESEGNDINIKLTPSSKKIEYQEDEYSDLSNATFLVDELVKMSEYQGYNLHFDYPLEIYDLDVDVNIIDENNIETIFTITDENEVSSIIEVYYLNSKFYLNLENYILEVEKEDLDLLIGYIVSFIQGEENGDISDSTSTPEDEVVEEIPSEEKDIVEIIYDVIGVIYMEDENTLNVPLLISSIDSSLVDTEALISTSEDKLKINLKDYHLDLLIGKFDKEINLPSNKTIYSKETIDIVSTHVTNIEELLKKENIQFTFDDVEIKNDERKIVLNGEYIKNQENFKLELSSEGTFNLRFRVIKLEGKYYLSLGEDTYRVNIALNEKQMETFIEYLDEIMNYILGENDFSSSLEDFINDIVSTIMSILNGEFDVSLGQLLFDITQVLDNSDVEIDDRTMIFEFDQSKIELYKLSDNYMLMVDNVEYQDTGISGDVLLKEREVKIELDSTTYLDISEIFEDLEIPQQDENNESN